MYRLYVCIPVEVIMVKPEVDRVLEFPYGATILLSCSSTVSMKDVKITSQLRNILGNYLADMEIRKQDDKHFLVFTNDLIPVGEHVLDIRFEQDNPVLETKVYSASEPIIIAIRDSVTRYPAEDQAGKDRRYV